INCARVAGAILNVRCNPLQSLFLLPNNLNNSGITMNEHSNTSQGNTSFIVLISCIATIGGFLFGFDSGVINGTVDGLQTAFNSDSMGTGFSVSSMLLGCAVGAFFAGTLA